MKFQLKNVKHAEFASQETDCYEATLYVDGKRVASVSNDGHGGADNVYPIDREALAAAEAYLAEQPPVETGYTNDDGSPFTVEQTLETKCHELLTAWLIERDVKRALKRRVCFTKPGEAGIYQLGAKFKPTPTTIERVAREKPEWRILNTLPLDKAVEAWKQAAA